jgi:hypothetical protein
MKKMFIIIAVKVKSTYEGGKFSIKRDTEIEYSKLGDKAGVLSAASYALSDYFK